MVSIVLRNRDAVVIRSKVVHPSVQRETQLVGPGESIVAGKARRKQKVVPNKHDSVGVFSCEIFHVTV